MWKFWAAIEILDFCLIRAVSAQAPIPTILPPDPFHNWTHRCNEQIIMVEDFADAPLFGCRSLPELRID